MTPNKDPIHARQRSRALVTAVCLGAFVLLMFGISIAKMTMITP